MADNLSEYQNKVHNTLAKVVIIDFVDTVNQLSATSNPDKKEEFLLDLARRADVRGCAIRGSGLYSFVEPQPDFPRNPNDLDLQVVAGKQFDASRAISFARELLEYSAEKMGAAASHPDKDGRRKMTISGKIAYFLGRKASMLIDADMTPEQLKRVLEKADHYHLQSHDREIIQQIIDGKLEGKLSVKVDIKGLVAKPDFPPVDFKGREIALEDGKFHGIVMQHFLEQAVEKIHALCNPARDNPLDQLDLYNFMRLHGREDARMTKEDIDEVKKRMFRPNSAWRTHHRAYAAAHGRWAAAFNGLPQYTKQAPTEDDVRKVREQYQRLEQDDELARVPSDDVLRTVLNAAYENATTLLGKPKSVADKATEKVTEQRAMSSDGRTALA